MASLRVPNHRPKSYSYRATTPDRVKYPAIAISQPGWMTSSPSKAWDTDLHDLSCVRLRHPEKVQVVIQPTHSVLEGNVEVPEAVGLGHLDSSPDRWRNPQEEDLELVHMSLLAHR